MSEEIQKKSVREVIADTETTGLKISDGNRIIEVGFIEVIDNVPTGRELHYYINPEGQKIEQGAYNTHKISEDFLIDKPVFSDVADEIEEFLKDAKFVAHNAHFDAEFLDMEFKKLGKPSLYDTVDGIVDTLKIAKQLFPGKKKSLDALLKIYEIDDSSRKDAHGAHIDAKLLLEIYKKFKLEINTDAPDYEQDRERQPIQRIDLKGFKPALIQVSQEDIRLHEDLIDGLTNPVERKSENKQVEEAKPAPAKKSFF